MSAPPLSRRSTRPLVRITRNIFAGIGFLWVVITATPITCWWARALAGDWNDPDGDVLIVLGAEDPSRGMIGRATYWRTFYAKMAWQGGHFQSIIVSGGGGTAETMLRLLSTEGIPAGCITIEPLAENTRDNAMRTATLLHGRAGKKVLMTSDFHMFRAYRTFLKAGVEVVPRPVPDALKRCGDWQGRWPVFLELLTESAKIVGYWIRGRI